MKYLLRNKVLIAVFFISLSLLGLGSCGDDDMSDQEDSNETPVIANALSDLNLLTGFGTEEVELSDVFSDPENGALTLSILSDDETIVTVSMVETTLTITEIGEGSTDITVTAEDDSDNTISDVFSISVTEAEVSNQPPVVAEALSDVTISTGFGTEEVELSGTFSDPDGNVLILNAQSDDEDVVTVSVTGTVLMITEVGEGIATVTVSADDTNGSTVDDSFIVSIENSETDCTMDNSTSFTLNECTNDAVSAGLTAEYSETITNDVRTIDTNGVPNHSFGSPNDRIEAINVTWTVDATPEIAGTITPVLGKERIDFQFGIGLNGVKLDPEADFPFENTSTGELNYDWILEATNNTETTTLDCNQAHLQAQGAYHYHGDFVGYAEVLGVDGSEMVQVGWAADGFPIYYKYGYNYENEIVEMQSSYQLKIGNRPGDGVSEPCGEYNGKYEQDYEYSETVGDLDECNGRTGVTPEFPDGTYYYLKSAC